MSEPVRHWWEMDHSCGWWRHPTDVFKLRDSERGPGDDRLMLWESLDEAGQLAGIDVTDPARVTCGECLERLSKVVSDELEAQD